MFDFSFGEILVVGAVALVVIGPERLPTVARTVGAMVARLQRYVAGVKADIQREIEFDNLKQLEAEMHEAGRKLVADVEHELAPLHDGVQNAAEEAKVALAEPPTQTASVASTPDIDDKQFDLFAHEPLSTPTHVTPAPQRDRR